MKRFLSAAVVFSCVLSEAWSKEPFQIHARFDFDDPGMKNYVNEIFYEPSGKASVSVKAFPTGKPSRRLKLKLVPDFYGGEGYALEVEKNSDAQILYLGSFGSIPSHPKLKAAFCIYTDESCRNGFQIYIGNPIRKQNLATRIPCERGRWILVRHTINGPGYFENGTPVNNFGIESLKGKERVWRIDNLVIWSGDDSEAPEEVGHLKADVSADGVNRLSWKKSKDNLFVVKYHIYRGTIPGFTADEKTLIGKSVSCEFSDKVLMRREYYYIVRAEDCEGNLSHPGASLRVSRDIW